MSIEEGLLLEDEIYDFIYRRFEVDNNWITGNCYFMALILNHVFDLPIYYLPVEGHFVVFNSKTEHFLDWLGTVKLAENESPILFSKLKDTDPQWYTRIIRDCVR